MSGQTYSVTVVIVTYHSKKTIKSTLDALKESHDLKIANIVVVDNASSDGTADIIAENYPWVTLVRSKHNVGFGNGCNYGFKSVKTKYVMFLNPDAVIDLQSLRKMVDFMEQHPNAGMCGPAIKEASGDMPVLSSLPNPWKIIMNPLFGKWISGNRQFVIPGEAPFPAEWICGACMLLRRDAFEKIKGFDPRFFLYFEETDLSLRIQKSGGEVWTVGEALCEHVNAASARETKEHMTGDTISEHFFKSRFYYLGKHFGWIWAITAELGEIVFMGIRTLLDLLRGKVYRPLIIRLQGPVLKLPSRIYVDRDTE